jgi:hypothetical protein
VSPEFESRLAAALRAPVPGDARARASIMTRVRALGPAERPVRRPALALVPRRTRHSIVGVALAAGIGSLTTFGANFPAPIGGAPVVIGDSVTGTLRDTLRLVRLIFQDSTARQVAAVGDFNGWRADATPMRRDAGGRWSATLALRDGAHRYAFVVDGTRHVADPAARVVRGDDGRLHSLLRVARATN